MPKIKICGLSRKSDIEAVNELLPDYIGFVFAKGSKRLVDEETAKNLKNDLNPSIKAVGVFVNEEMEKIIRLCNSHIIDIIQLHGDEGEEYIKELKNHVPNKIIKAVRVRSNEDILKVSSLSSDFLLLDTYQENEYGGSGKTFDWSMISEYDKPYFLAGGIHTDNVIQAIKMCHPYCIDVSSGVETDGVKDPVKINDIITKIREVEYKT